jgi:hypothetical protein
MLRCALLRRPSYDSDAADSLGLACEGCEWVTSGFDAPYAMLSTISDPCCMDVPTVGRETGFVEPTIEAVLRAIGA